MESAFGVDHGISKRSPTGGLIAIKGAKLDRVVGRGLSGKHAKPMPAVTSGSAPAGKRRLGGGTHSTGMFAR